MAFLFKRNTSGRTELTQEMKRMGGLLAQIGVGPLTEWLKASNMEREVYVFYNGRHVNKVEVQGITREEVGEYRAQINVYAENRRDSAKDSKVLGPVRRLLRKEGYEQF